MIYRCPNCGYTLNHPTKAGLTSCTNCHFILEANQKNRLLSAAWELRKFLRMDFDQFLFRTKLDETEARYVFHCIAEEGYSHDEFLKLLNNNK